MQSAITDSSTILNVQVSYLGNVILYCLHVCTMHIVCCTGCNCDAQGSVEEVCSKQDGTCLCRDGYGGRVKLGIQF